MSLDAKYILHYDCQNYIKPSPMDIDKKYLEETFGGEVVEIGWEYDLFYDKPKYTLLPEHIKELRADQILECRDLEHWVDITHK